MSASFDVYIDGTRDGSAAAVAQLATQIARSFGIEQGTVAQYLARGRFRVQGGLDATSAQKLALQLRQFGAKVTIEPAGGVAPPLPSASPPPRAPLPLPLPPSPAPPAPVSAGVHNPARNVATPVVSGGQRFESGLAAAFSAEASSADSLGALDIGSISLSTLDGNADEHEEQTRVAGGPVPLSDDAFSAPDEHDDQDALDMAPLPLKHHTPVPFASPPPASEAPLAAGPIIMSMHGSSPAPQGQLSTQFAAVLPAHDGRSQPVRSQGATAVQGEGMVGRFMDHFHASARVRWLSGVVLAIVIGFVPSALYGSMAAEGKYAAVQKELAQQYAAAESRTAWEALDASYGPRAIATGDLSRARSRLRISSALIWIGGAAAVAWLWRRKFVADE